MVKIKLI